MKEITFFLKNFLRYWPPHLSIIRAHEAVLFQKLVTPQEPSLDLGCGNGRFSLLVFDKIDVGFDISWKEIRRAKKWGPYKYVIKCDAYRIPFPDNFFKLIISNCVFEHIPDPFRLIQEIARVISLDGELVFTTWSPQFQSSLFLSNQWYINWKNRILNHHSILNIEEWMAILNNNGFKITTIQKYLPPEQIKKLDFWELISLIGVWKLRMINLYKLGASLLPDRLLEKIANKLSKIVSDGQDSDSGCGVIIKAVKKSNVWPT